MSEPTTMICALVANVPDPVEGSSQGRCYLCGAAVWVSPASLEALATFGETQIACTPCGVGMMATTRKPKLQPITEAQKDELRKWSAAATDRVVREEPW